MDRKPATRRGNVQRAEWRYKCRQMLARHLRTQLGILVEPNQVRLQPQIDDGYAWIRQPEREHLFKRPLSKHSVGAYMELCREVGASIEAIPQSDFTTPGQSSKHEKVSTSLINLTFQVTQLRAETTMLTNQLSQCENRAQTERGAHLQAEGKIRELQTELTSTRTEMDNLRQEKMHLFSVNRRLTKKIDQRDREVKKALSALYQLEPDP